MTPADSPRVLVDPAMRFGRPHVKGIPVDAIVEQLSVGGSVDAVAQEFDLTRADVLVAAWYIGLFGLPESPRIWRRALREWARDAGQAMWNTSECDYAAIPDPPIGDKPERHAP